MRADRDDRHRDRDADRGQREAEPHRGSDLAPAGGQTALGQDDRQGREAEGVRQLGVLEPDAEAGLPERHAHQQVDEQRGQAGARREPHGQDGEQGDGGPHEHERVELVDVEGHCHLSRWGGGYAVYRRAGDGWSGADAAVRPAGASSGHRTKLKHVLHFAGEHQGHRDPRDHLRRLPRGRHPELRRGRGGLRHRREAAPRWRQRAPEPGCCCSRRPPCTAARRPCRVGTSTSVRARPCSRRPATTTRSRRCTSTSSRSPRSRRRTRSASTAKDPSSTSTGSRRWASSSSAPTTPRRP